MTTTTSVLAPIVIIDPTVMDGRVVRWYTSAAAAERGRELVSASRNGVSSDAMVRTDQAADLADLVRVAGQVAELLVRGRDVSDLATHRRPFMRGPIEPIQEVTP